MEEQLAIQKLLRSYFLTAQSKNPKFSLRSYSRLVGIHAGALSSIMNGKRNVSVKLAEKITRKLLINPQQRIEILSLFPIKRSYTKSEDVVEPTTKFLEIEASSFKLMAEWEHFAVLSLIKTSDFKNDMNWIGERLGISKFRAQEVVERLLSLGFLKITPEGELIRTKSNIRSSDDTVNLSVRKAHEETLDLAKESLHRDSLQQRDFTSLTMAFDPDKMGIAKEMIRKFQNELSEVVGVGNTKEVYRISVQFFPLTKDPQVSVEKDLVQ